MMSVALLNPPAAQADDQPGPGLYELVSASADRLQTADPVAASKWLAGAAITDTARAGQVLDAVAAQAATAGVDPVFVRSVFTDQIDANEAIQYSRFAAWKLDPATAPAEAPDLSASRAVIDGLNRRIVGEIGLRWTALQDPLCPAQLAVAKAAVALTRGLDPVGRRALDTATRSFCA